MTNSHTDICDSCEQLKDIITVMPKMLPNTSDHIDDVKRVRFRINQAQSINNLKQHLVIP